MENLIEIKFTWPQFLLVAITLLALYLLLRFLRRLFRNTEILGKYHNTVFAGLNYILLIYEPLVMLILISTFILINPIFHGLVLGLLFLTGFSYFRNYLIGRLIQLDNPLSTGKWLKSQDLQGIVSKIGRFGLHLNTGKGLHFISYTKLQSNSFTFLAGDQISGFYQLHITPANAPAKPDFKQTLIDQLITAPYLDRSHKPEFSYQNQDDDKLDVKVLVREETHLHELMSLINEWGYTCKLSKKQT